MKRVSTAGRDAELSFYRTRSGMEADLLVKTAPGLIGVEVRNRDGALAKDSRALRSLAVATGEEWRGALVVQAGSRLRRLAREHDICSVPAHRLL